MWGKTHGRCLIMQTLIDDTSINHTCPNSIALMSTEQTYQVIPKIQFQVLIIGRANAGKTLILQQFCDTMEIPTIYRWEENGRKEEVHGPKFVCESDLTADQVTLDLSMDVSDNCTSLRLPTGIDLDMALSKASTPSTMSLCSPIIWATFFMILVESSWVA